MAASSADTEQASLIPDPGVKPDAAAPAVAEKRLIPTRETAIRRIAVMLVAIHVLLLAYSGFVHSPTLNEPAHLMAGISYWKFHRFELYRVNPPLTRLVSAVPALIAGAAEADWTLYYEHSGARPEYNLGPSFTRTNGERIFWLVSMARWMCIPFSVLGAFVVFRWSKELYGSAAGLLSLALYCFSPNLLAHGALITPDASATALGVTAAYAFWHWLKKSTWRSAMLAGAILGLAQLTKMTLIILLPLWLVLWLLWRGSDRAGIRSAVGWLRSGVQLCFILGLGLYVLNLGYGFEGTGEELGSLPFVSKVLTSGDDRENRFSGGILSGLPVPLPRNYLLGMDIQMRDLEGIQYPSYLRGEFRNRGWWYYYLYGLAVKVPLGTWLLLILAIGARCLGPRLECSLRDEIVLLTPLFAILAMVSSQTGFSEHFRYVLPIFPFAIIWIGQAARWWSSCRRSIPGVACLIWAVASSIAVYPHSLSYFNEVAGGARNGHNHLIVSNIDWGQDLLYLKEWVNNHPDAGPLYVAFYGDIDPALAGIRFTMPPPRSSGLEDQPMPSLEPGWYAISVNFLRGYPWRLIDGDGNERKAARHAFSYFRIFQPVARAGYSIYIFHLTAEDLRNQ